MTGYGEEMRPNSPPDPVQRRSPIRLTAVLVLAVAAAFLVWLFVRDDDNSSTTETTTQTTTSTTARVRPLLTAVTPQRLATLASTTGQPIYWAGPRPRVTYELTRTTDGRYFVRYLPRGVRVGNRSGQYLLVGTYPVRDAYKAVRRAAKQSGAHTFRVPGGGLAVVNDRAPKNVYFAYPRNAYQVEVFDPSGRQARQLVASGAVKPVR
jgi:hypothetical protein